MKGRRAPRTGGREIIYRPLGMHDLVKRQAFGRAAILREVE
jgi:hypothetical protein